MLLTSMVHRSDDELTAGGITPYCTPRKDHLRVALFSGNYNYVRDGANRTLNRLVEFLERQNIAVRIYAPTTRYPAFAPAGALISVRSIPIPGRSEYRLGLGLPAAVRADLAEFRPTLFHLSAPDLIGLSALRLARRWGLPAVASYHTRFETYFRYYGLGALEPFARRYLRDFYSQCEHVYVPSPCIARELAGWNLPTDIRLWSRGVDRTIFSPQKRDLAWRARLGVSAEIPLIAFVGRLVREKGLDPFAEVLHRLAAAGTPHKVLVVGDGPERTRLAQALPQATFTGHLDGEALSRAYASADIFFNPSTTETFGNVTLEAMASGVATVCAAATGSRSLVRSGLNGVLIEPDNLDGFVAVLAHLATDSAMRLRMGIAARRISALYEWDQVMAGLLGSYCEALDAPLRAADAGQAAPFTSPLPAGSRA